MTPPTSDIAPTLTVQRTFAASRERVFRAWTDPGALERWFRPMRHGVVVRTLDARVGGAFCFEMDGSGDAIIGTYLEVVRPERLVSTWSSVGTRHEETLVTVEFVACGLATEVILTQAWLGDAELRALRQAGRQSVFDGLAGALSE